MTDLEVFPRYELTRQSRRHKRAAAGHVVMLIGNLAVLFLDRSTPRRGVPRMVLFSRSPRRIRWMGCSLAAVVQIAIS